MKPVEAEIHYKKPKIGEDGEPVIENEVIQTEDAVAKGVLVDIFVMRDKTNESEVDEAYALFFEDKGDYSVPSLENLSDIHIPNNKMRAYVSSFYGNR